MFIIKLCRLGGGSFRVLLCVCVFGESGCIIEGTNEWEREYLLCKRDRRELGGVECFYFCNS